MGQIERRSTDEIREKAIATAVAKHDEGCENCAAAYIDVARQHGATEADVRRAGIGRRGFLKFAVALFAATSAATAVNLIRPQQSVKASQLLRGDYLGSFGVDSCTPLATATGQAMPLQFYVAEVGATQYGLGCFDAATAGYVGRDFAHGYWGLCGPNNATDPVSYGRLQADLAIASLQANAAVGAKTFFADVETGFGGWGDPATPQQNAKLLDAFLSTIAAAGYVPGVYIDDYNRDTWFPSDWVASVPFVYWVAGGPSAGTMCAPCAPDCDTLTPVQQLWDSDVSSNTFGGYRAVVWQYWLSNFGCGGDYNFSPQSAYHAFSPVSVKDAPVLTKPQPGTTPAQTPSTTPPATPAPSETPAPVFQPTPSMG